MALSKDEFQRRVRAMTTLRAMKLSDLRDGLEERGLPRMSAERAGQPSGKSTKPHDTLAYALSQILNVSQKWFEVEEWNELLVENDGASELRAVRKQLKEVLRRLQRIERAVEPDAARLERDEEADFRQAQASDQPSEEQAPGKESG
jgi:hypothetical protein